VYIGKGITGYYVHIEKWIEEDETFEYETSEFENIGEALVEARDYAKNI